MNIYVLIKMAIFCIFIIAGMAATGGALYLFAYSCIWIIHLEPITWVNWGEGQRFTLVVFATVLGWSPGKVAFDALLTNK